MSLQSVAHPDIAKVHSMLSKMDGPQLQQFAAAHQDNAIYVSLAMQVDKDRKEEMQRLQALMNGQEQPKVMQQVIAALNPQGMAPPGMGSQQGQQPPQGQMPPQGMPPQGPPQGMPPQGMPPQGMPPAPQMPPQMPPPSGPSAAPQGLAALPAQNIQNMADGGIAGYADADEVPRYDGATTSLVRTPNVSMTPEMLRDPGYNPWENPPTGSELWAGQEPMGSFIARGFRNLLPGGEREEYDIAANRARELPVAQAAVQQQRDIRRPPRNVAAPSAEEYAASRSIYGDATMPMPAAPPAPAVPAPPAQTYADLLKATSGSAPRIGVGAGMGAGKPPTLEIPKPLTVEQAQMQASQFFDPKELYAQQDKIAAAARERQADTLSFARTNRPPAPFQELSKRLDAEEFAEVGEKEKAKGMALMMAGFKMMESPYGGKGLGSFLRNLGAGATVGGKELQQSNKEFKELAQKRLQLRTTIEAAQNAADRGDFERELALRTRGDELNNSIDQNKQRIAEHAFGLTGNAALNAFNHSEDKIAEAKRAQFSADVQRDIAATNERGANARANAQIQATKEAALFAANLPSAQAKFYGELGGALPGTVPTSAQINAGLERVNSVNDVETAMLAYEKLRNERAKMMATNPMVQIEPLPDQNTWLKQFMEQKRAFAKLNQGLYSGINVTNTPGNAPVYGR
jgi:hypothetical protein